MHDKPAPPGDSRERPLCRNMDAACVRVLDKSGVGMKIMNIFIKFWGRKTMVLCKCDDDDYY